VNVQASASGESFNIGISRYAVGVAGDIHSGKWNGLGGKLEKDESAEHAAIREVKEEAGIDLNAQQLKWSGCLHFPNFKPHKNEDWMVSVFRAQLNDEQILMLPSGTAGPEGSLHWIDRTKLLDLNLWEGDREFLPLVLQGKVFTGTFWYLEGKLERFTLLRP
jgi:8-oxo-dGTP diphosphatase